MRILILLLIVASEIRANDCVGLFDKKTSALENIFLEKNQELLSESVPHYYKAIELAGTAFAGSERNSSANSCMVCRK